MARHQDRNWHVLPKARKMIWRPYEDTEIDIEAIAFAFDGDTTLWLTANGTVVDGAEALNRDWDTE